MNITPHQAKYYAYELSKKCKSDSAEKFGATLLDAKVDLNPHQVEAALFAFKSPLSKGAILADEVGLGKTIEAGILLSQKWAEGSKRILIICPSSLRKQWANELEDKFYLPSEVIETKSFNKKFKGGNKNPFDNKTKIQICSYHFARNKAEYIQLNSWDLVVLDEAHYIRNVYRTGNKIAKEIQNAIHPFKKVLLTATPLQNKLEELYGLVSFIDENVFGDIKSFRKQFTRKEGGIDFEDLKTRIASICHRTLRSQVTEYINYKNRIPVTETFEPSGQEQNLYDSVTEYLQREEIYGLPKAQRHLMTSVLRKLLASSSYAIAGTLESLIKRLNKVIDGRETSLDEWENEIDENYELYDESVEEWEEEDENPIEDETLSKEDTENIRKEIQDLENYLFMANAIEQNAKGEKLILSLDKGFEKLKELGASQKAIIFTESTRTQKYLNDILQKTHFNNKIVLFNGSNNDEKSSEVYKKWVTDKKNIDKISGSKDVDIRNAIVDEFKSDNCQLMIATEAAAEGINLQFCSMVVNYDLPWNPQRIEQRIGRCHRYGQEHDVVVINFLNTKNETDQRVFQLLEEKFSLFDGVFGSSDEVLGTIGSGVDFEKRLIEIYKKCRTKEEIKNSFDALQKDLEEQINNNLKTTQNKLFENFDAQVVNKLKTSLENTQKYISKYEQWLWKITKYILKDIANFDDKTLTFNLNKSPIIQVKSGIYTLDKKREDAKHYRLSDFLAQDTIHKSKKLETPVVKLNFEYSSCGMKYLDLEKLNSKKGFLKVVNLNLNSNAEENDLIIFAGATETGEVLKDELCQFLLTLNGNTQDNLHNFNTNKVDQVYQEQKKKHLDFVKHTDTKLLQLEIQKFEKWANDKIDSSELELREVKKKIKDLERETRADNLNADDLLEIQKKIRVLDRKKSKLRREIFDIEDNILAERDEMIEDAERKLERTTTETEIFTIEWELI
jgi:ERCC4-related helicase